MENDRDMFKFFNEFFFLDHLEVGIDVNVNVLRRFVIIRFHETLPFCRKTTTPSLLDDVLLKLCDKNLKGKQDDMYTVRENVLYTLSFENFVDDNLVDENE